ncbi:MAG: hypothetical protein J6Y01_07435 [Spirochaetales bacterium]|nr:hypothetical protein [Spirochaetales bacterium]
MKQKTILTILLLIMVSMSINLFAASEADIETATQMAKDYRLKAPKCPTLEEVANKQLVDIRWTNPGGGDESYCFVKLSGFQKNHEFFAVLFRYDVESQRVEPYSIRKGAKETFKIDEVQKQLMRFYATESMEVWQLLKRVK